MLIGLNKIPQVSFMGAFAESLLSILDPNNNSDPSLGLELGLGLGLGAEGARRSMSTKGARRKILSTLHRNTILEPNLDPNAHPQPSA